MTVLRDFIENSKKDISILHLFEKRKQNHIELYFQQQSVLHFFFVF